MKRSKLAIIFGLVVLAVIQSAIAADTSNCVSLGTFAPGATVTITDPSYSASNLYTWDNGFPGITGPTPPTGTWTWVAPTSNANQYPKTYTGNLVVTRADLASCAIAKCYTIIVAPTSDCKLTPDTGYTVCETDDTEKTFTYTPKLTDNPSSTNKVVWTITNGATITSLPASGASLSGTGDTTLKIKWKTFVAATSGPGDYTVTATFNDCAKSTTVTVEPIPTIGTITAV
jgi:hypothetical protein